MVLGKEALLKLGEAIKSALPTFDATAGPILITGGDGVVAYRVALRLVAAGYPLIRVGVPNPASLKDLQDAGAEVVEFDWEKEETYSKALNGIKSVFLAIPHHENWEHQFSTFLQNCKTAGVAHIVKLSIVHSLATQADSMGNFCTATRKDDPFLKVPLVLMHRECDAKLMKLPMNYTILFASHFMSNATVYQGEQIRSQHEFTGASRGHGVNYVSPNDVADVAVRALLAPGDHARKGYTLTGPAAMKDSQVAETLSKRLGTEISYVDKSLTSFAQNTQATDWGPARDVAYLEYAKASGVEEDPKFVSKDISHVCGHDAETYDDYLMAQDFMTPRELVFLMP